MVEVQPPQHTTNNCNTNNNGDDGVYSKYSSTSSALPINNNKPRAVLPGVDHSYKNFSGYNRPHHNHSRAAQNNSRSSDYTNTQHQIRQNHSSSSVGNGVQRIKKFTPPPTSSYAQHTTQNNSHMSQNHTSHNIKDRSYYPQQQERATAYNRTAAERSQSDSVGRRTVSSDFHTERPRSSNNYDYQPTSYTLGPNERINSTTIYERSSRNSISGAGGYSSSSRGVGESSSRIRSEIEDRDSRLFNIRPGGEKRSSFEGGRREELSNNRDMTRTVSAGSYSQFARDSGGGVSRAVNPSREFSRGDHRLSAAGSSYASLAGEDLRVRVSGRDYPYAQGGYREERRVQQIDGGERSTSSYSSKGGYSTAVDNSKKRARDYSYTVEREGARDVGSSYPPPERRAVPSDDYSKRNRWGEEKSTTAAPQSSSYQQPKSYVGNKFRDAPPKSNEYMYEERYESSSRISGGASRGEYSRIAERSGGVARGEYSQIADRASKPASPQRGGRDEYPESRRSLPTYRGEYRHHSSSSYRQSEMNREWEDKGKSYTSSEVRYSSRKESPISRHPPQQREQWDNPNSPGRPQYKQQQQQQQQQQRDHPSSPNSRQHQQQQPREEISRSQAVQHQESKR